MIKTVLVAIVLSLYLYTGLKLFVEAIITMGGVRGYKKYVVTYHPKANFTLVLIMAVIFTVFLWPVPVINGLRKNRRG